MSIYMQQSQSTTGLFAQAAHTVMAFDRNRRQQEQHDADMALQPLKVKEAELNLETAGLNLDQAKLKFAEWEDQAEGRRKLFENSVLISDNAVEKSIHDVDYSKLKLTELRTASEREELRWRWEQSDRTIDEQMDQYELEARRMGVDLTAMDLLARRRELKKEARKETHRDLTLAQLDSYEANHEADFEARYNDIVNLQPNTEEERIARSKLIRLFQKDWRSATGAMISGGDATALKQAGFVDYGQLMDEVVAGDEGYADDVKRIRRDEAEDKRRELMAYFSEQQYQWGEANRDQNEKLGGGNVERDWTPENALGNTIELLNRELKDIRVAEMKHGLTDAKRQELNEAKNVLVEALKDFTDDSAIVKVLGKDVRMPISDITSDMTVRRSYNEWWHTADRTRRDANSLVKDLGVMLNRIKNGVPVGPAGYSTIENRILDISDVGLSREDQDTRERDVRLNRTKYRISEEARKQAEAFNVQARELGIEPIIIPGLIEAPTSYNNPEGLNIPAGL